MEQTPVRTGIANLPLHYGKAPPWLFEKMIRLAREITLCIIAESGPREMLHRMSDPYWFQAFGCVLGFDWHSSGITTTLCGALKEALRGLEYDTGLFITGGKGRTSRQPPLEIQRFGSSISADLNNLVYASRMTAKVDTSAIQDGYQLYHHSFMFTQNGSWAVAQQGMNKTTKYARRYHWLDSQVNDFVCEPHAAICTMYKANVLNLVAAESEADRNLVTCIATENTPKKNLLHLDQLKNLNLPQKHHITVHDINPSRISK